MTCLKCGRTVPEGTLLCAECRVQRPMATAPKPAPIREEQLLPKLHRSRRRLRRWLAVSALVILCLIGLAAGLFHYLHEQNSRIAAQTSRINSLETAISDVQKELDQANALNDTLRGNMTNLQQALAAYETLTGLSPEEVTAAPNQAELLPN